MAENSRPLPAGARLTALVDACHSGCMLRLPYSMDWDEGGLRRADGARPGPSGSAECAADVLMISAAQAGEAALDGTGGVFTNRLSQVLNSAGFEISVEQLLLHAGVLGQSLVERGQLVRRVGLVHGTDAVRVRHGAV